MIKFPAQFHSYRKTTLGENLIVFSVIEEHSSEIADLVSAKIGTQYLVGLEDTTSPEEVEQSPEMEERFRNKMHALLKQVADLNNSKLDRYKTELKKTLIVRGLIKNSTKELDIKGLAIACNIVEEWIKAYENIN